MIILCMYVQGVICTKGVEVCHIIKNINLDGKKYTKPDIYHGGTIN